MIDETFVRDLQYLIDRFYEGFSSLLKLDSVTKNHEIETLYAIGYNFFHYGRYAAAREIFRKLTIINPTSEVYWRALGAIFQQERNYPAAIAAYERAIELNPNDIISYVYLSESYLLAKMKKRGIETLEKALELPFFEQNPWRKRAVLLSSRNKLSTEGGRENNH